MKRIFGRYAISDERDKKYKIKAIKSIRTYRYWNDSKCWGDQLNTPHCVGYAWMHWLAAAPIISWLNADGIYYLAQQNDEWEGEDYDGTSVRAGAKVLRMIGLIDSYKWCWDLDMLITTVLDLGPVVVGTNWYTDMENPDKSGILHVSGNNLGGHAYAITGVSKKTELFRMKNSWNRIWGKNGRAYITFEDMAKLIKEDGEVCLAMEREAKFKVIK